MRTVSLFVFTLAAIGCGGEEMDPPPAVSDDLAEVRQALTKNNFLPTDGKLTLSLPAYPNDRNVLIMRSPSAGTWKFTTRGSPISFGTCSDGAVVVFTYWRDLSDPNGGWHHWPGGGPVCWPFAVFSTDLWSGSADIAYMFVYVFDHADGDFWGETVYATFEKR